MGNVFTINPAGFSLVKRPWGTGQSFAVVVGGTDTIANVMSISNAGYTVSDNSGNMKQSAAFVTPTGMNLPYGIFYFIVTVPAGAATKIVIVPPPPFRI